MDIINLRLAKCDVNVCTFVPLITGDDSAARNRDIRQRCNDGTNKSTVSR